MNLLYIFGVMIGIVLLSWVVGAFADKFTKLWRQAILTVILFGGLWLASEGDHQTLRAMAFLLPFALIYAIWMHWQDAKRNE